MRRRTGTYDRVSVAGEHVDAFVPFPLPPRDPPLTLVELHRKAAQALLRLELADAMVPSVEWLVYAFVRREAALSAQIEGAQATLLDLLEVEAAGGAPTDADEEDVCGYLDALKWAWAELPREDGPPLSMRLLSKTHRRLLQGARGRTRQPAAVVPAPVPQAAPGRLPPPPARRS